MYYFPHSVYQGTVGTKSTALFCFSKWVSRKAIFFATVQRPDPSHGPCGPRLPVAPSWAPSAHPLRRSCAASEYGLFPHFFVSLFCFKKNPSKDPPPFLICLLLFFFKVEASYYIEACISQFFLQDFLRPFRTHFLIYVFQRWQKKACQQRHPVPPATECPHLLGDCCTPPLPRC